MGIAPSGQVTFLSRLFSGYISDREIVCRSGFIDLLSNGDNVMADRGFNIRDLLLQKNAQLNIPAFSGGKQLSARAVRKPRRIVSVKIHVECAMKRLKNFKILLGIVPLKLKNSMDQILLVCALLGNLSSPLQVGAPLNAGDILNRSPGVTNTITNSIFTFLERHTSQKPFPEGCKENYTGLLYFLAARKRINSSYCPSKCR